MFPSRVKVTIAVISTSGLACDAGGGFQHVRNLTNASLMLSTCRGWACAAQFAERKSSDAANQSKDLPDRATDPALRSGMSATVEVDTQYRRSMSAMIESAFARAPAE